METDRVRTVYDPRPIRVSVGGHRVPRWIAGGRVARINDRWRVDDLWWREPPVSRMYWRVELADGRVETVFEDLLTGAWYRQPYGPPDG